MMLEQVGSASTFLIFFVNAIILFFFIWTKIPETKQRTLEEIEQSWKH
jgi:SP family arabinose:H+ symporter-like MFS transporter